MVLPTAAAADDVVVVGVDVVCAVIAVVGDVDVVGAVAVGADDVTVDV